MSINSYIAKQFSRPAGVGGKLISTVMNRQNRPLYVHTIRMLALSDGDSVLDVGCGNGYVLDMLARRFDCEYAGIDVSPSIIKTASQRNNRAVKNGKMKLMCQDVGKMTFADNTFSRAYSINTVYFWGSLDDVMDEIWRILKPGGLFVNTLYSNETLSRFAHSQHGYKRFSLEQLAKSGIGAGFSVKVIPVQNGSAYCVLYNKG